MKKVSIAIFIVIASLSFASLGLAAWTNPGADPPNGNPSPPLDTSATAQTKSGALTAGSLTSNGAVGVAAANYLKWNNETAWSILGRSTSPNTTLLGTALKTTIFPGNAGTEGFAVVTGDTSNSIFEVNNSGNAYISNALGIGMSPTKILDLRKDQNGDTSIRVTNATVGASANAGITFSADGSTETMKVGIDRNSPGSEPFVWIPGAQALRIYTNALERVRITSGGNVGIGTTGPNAKLEVVGNGLNALIGDAGCGVGFAGIGMGGLSGCTNYALLGNQTETWINVPGAAGGMYFRRQNGDLMTLVGTTLTVGGGTGKINAGTVDPIYTIGGKQYATYLPGMTGVKEETAGTVILSGGKYEIDFGKAAKGSDLWLFWQVTDFGADWKDLTVLLTPSFDDKIWYRKDPAAKKLIIYASRDGEVSYRLTAPRFDHASWPNTSTDNTPGFTIPEK